MQPRRSEMRCAGDLCDTDLRGAGTAPLRTPSGIRIAFTTLATVTALVGSANADTLPSGMIGPVIGGRQGIGDVEQQFGLGAVWGVEAGWQPMRAQQRVGRALRWRTLFSGYWSADSSNVAGGLRVIEMDLGGYLRFALGGRARYVDLGAGASVLRANVPLPPSDSRVYEGLFGELGLEQYVDTSTSVSFALRVGELGWGPTTISALIGVRFGV